MTTTPSLEKRIALALTDQIKTSAAVADLIQEVETAIVTADKGAEEAQARALDPVVIDPEAHQRMRDAQFLSRRLHAAMPRLQDRLAECMAAEYSARWNADCDAVEAKRDEKATEFASRCPQLIGELVELFRSTQAVDQECARINAASPPNEHRHLLGVELTARNLPAFSRDAPSISKTAQLPDCEHNAKLAWPPRQAYDPAMFAPAPFNRSRSAEWWKVKEEEARAVRERQEREAAEEEAKQRESWRGPRWWEGERA
jgi:hypothetical protein